MFAILQGMDSGFGGEDDSYNVYSEPWRKGASAASNIYRPTKNIDKDVYGDDLEKLVRTDRWAGFVLEGVGNLGVSWEL